MKYIDADKLIAEIERWRDKAKEKYNESTYSMGRCDALAEFRNHIVSLQQEQLPGIEESGIPGKDFIPVEWVDACEMYGKWKIVKVEQPDFPTTDEEIEMFLATHPKIKVPEKYKNPDWLFKKQEQPEVELEKFTQKMNDWKARYNHPYNIPIKATMAFTARMFYQYPNVARRWYDSLPKATMD